MRNKAAFCNVTFGFTGSGAPLSWQLNRSQKRAVEKEWTYQGGNRDKVRNFLNPSTPICDDDP
jgi:hypothetical protein